MNNNNNKTHVDLDDKKVTEMCYFHRYCGSELAGKTVKSVGNKMIIYSTSAHNNMPGWVADITFEEIAGCVRFVSN